MVHSPATERVRTETSRAHVPSVWSTPRGVVHSPSQGTFSLSASAEVRIRDPALEISVWGGRKEWSTPQGISLPSLSSPDGAGRAARQGPAVGGDGVGGRTDESEKAEKAEKADEAEKAEETEESDIRALRFHNDTSARTIARLVLVLVRSFSCS